MKITVIDNYDSFVYNLVDYIGRNPEVSLKVVRNDRQSAEEIIGERPDGIVVSPGPGRPEDAGISVDLIRKNPGIPLLGVCLGHQALAAAFSGKVIKARRVLHGKTSKISYCNCSLFKGMENPFEATRYHSLIVDSGNFPDELEITAKTGEGEIMGIKHKKLPFYGVQFHPESILTQNGILIVENFISIAGGRLT